MAVAEKVSKYEHFLNDVLREDLRKELESRDQLFETIASYTQLKQTISCILLLPKEQGLRNQVDLGCNFYVQSFIPDTSYIFVSIGLGIHLQFTLPEAQKYTEKKIGQLNKQVIQSNKTSAKLKGQIKFVTLALSELQGFDSFKDLKI